MEEVEDACDPFEHTMELQAVRGDVLCYTPWRDAKGITNLMTDEPGLDHSDYTNYSDHTMPTGYRDGNVGCRPTTEACLLLSP